MLTVATQDLASLYPGWRMRIYHNVTSAQADQASYLCSLACSHPSLDLCDVRTLPSLVQHQVGSRAGNKHSRRFTVPGEDPTSTFIIQLGICEDTVLNRGLKLFMDMKLRRLSTKIITYGQFDSSSC